MARALPLSVLLAVGALGCSPKFEDQSQLTTLRVLGVRKDKPYAVPGDTVKLSMLYDDGTLTDTDAGPKPKRDIQIAWMAGCENPLGDLYAGCFLQIAQAFKGGVSLDGGPRSGDAGASSKGPKLTLGAGPEFSFTLSPRIISNRPRPVDRSPPYGLAYVFFFICAGKLDLAPAGQDFPIACYSTKTGEQLGAHDFVAGYTAVYAYDGFHNENPVVEGFQVDASTITPECIDDACLLEEGVPPSELPHADAGLEASVEGGVRDAGRDSAADGNVDAGTSAGDAGPETVDPCRNPKAPTCIEVCDTEKQDDCPEHDVKLVTGTTAEHDTVAEARDPGKTLYEQSWINYYVDAGELVHDVKLLGDATTGYNEDHGTQIRAPKKLGTFHVWAVAHDSRGGTSWLKVALATRPKK